MVPVHAPFFMYAWVRETRRLTLIWACDGVMAHAQLHRSSGLSPPCPPHALLPPAPMQPSSPVHGFLSSRVACCAGRSGVKTPPLGHPPLAPDL